MTLVAVALLMVLPTEQRKHHAMNKKRDDSHVNKRAPLDAQAGIFSRGIYQPIGDRRSLDSDAAEEERGFSAKSEVKRKEPEVITRENDKTSNSRREQSEVSENEKRDFDFLYGKSENQIIFDMSQDLMKATALCMEDKSCNDRDLEESLAPIIEVGLRLYGEDVVDKAIAAMNDSNFEAPKPHKEQKDALLGQLRQAVDADENTFEVLQLVSDIFNAFAEKGKALDEKIAAANNQLVDQQIMLETRNGAVEKVRADIEALEHRYARLECSSIENPVA